MKISVKYDDIKHIVLENKIGMRVELSCYGASIYNIELLVDNEYKSMVLTPANLSDFYTNTSYHGKSIGRYSGRIDNARCVINNTTYSLDINWNNINSLHGGFNGLSSRVCEYKINEDSEYTDVVFSCVDDDKMLSGVVNYEIVYRIYEEANDIVTFLNATTSLDTLINLTNHTYFNLSGNCQRTILDHKLFLACSKYTKLNNNLITEEILDVDRVMDFRDNHKIGDYIEDPSLQNHTAKGYDHCFIKEDSNKDLVAILTDEQSGVSLSISSSYPAVVCYSGNYPDKFLFNKEKIENIKYHAICLEAQFVPNGINMDNVDKAILRKDEKYSHYIKYSFIKK